MVSTKILIEAKEEFGKEYEPKVKSLGYHLAYGIGINKITKSLGLVALVCNLDDNHFPDNLKQKIEDMIPQNYSYNGHQIPVWIEYRGPIRLRSC